MKIDSATCTVDELGMFGLKLLMRTDVPDLAPIGSAILIACGSLAMDAELGVRSIIIGFTYCLTQFADKAQEIFNLLKAARGMTKPADVERIQRAWARANAARLN